MATEFATWATFLLTLNYTCPGEIHAYGSPQSMPQRHMSRFGSAFALEPVARGGGVLNTDTHANTAVLDTEYHPVGKQYCTSFGSNTGYCQYCSIVPCAGPILSQYCIKYCHPSACRMLTMMLTPRVRLVMRARRHWGLLIGARIYCFAARGEIMLDSLYVMTRWDQL